MDLIHMIIQTIQRGLVFSANSHRNNINMFFFLIR